MWIENEKVLCGGIEINLILDWGSNWLDFSSGVEINLTSVHRIEIDRVCVAFTSNRSFYPATSVHPLSVMIHPIEVQILWSQTVRQRETKTTAIKQGKASEMLAYLVRERNRTSQTRKI